MKTFYPKSFIGSLAYVFSFIFKIQRGWWHHEWESAMCMNCRVVSEIERRIKKGESANCCMFMLPFIRYTFWMEYVSDWMWMWMMMKKKQPREREEEKNVQMLNFMIIASRSFLHYTSFLMLKSPSHALSLTRSMRLLFFRDIEDSSSSTIQPANRPKCSWVFTFAFHKLS